MALNCALVTYMMMTADVGQQDAVYRHTPGHTTVIPPVIPPGHTRVIITSFITFN